MRYEIENVNCSKCGEHHDKFTVQHGFVFDYFNCSKCDQDNHV